MGEERIDSTNLVGSVCSEMGIADVDFLIELERLMCKYQIHKLSVGWKAPFAFNEEAKNG